ncbi:MAG: SseB family protein [Rhodobacteraceae bacterium]|nr:SseB family protein [Paracoccaceae bacterium]
MTPIDRAHAEMQADLENDAARMRFYERLAAAELFLMLEDEAVEETIRPSVFEVEGQSYALVFDTTERMVEFAERPTPFVALSGRNIARLLAGQEIGLGLNLAVAPSSMLLPVAAVTWLHDTLGQGPEQAEARPVAVHGPGELPEQLITAFDAKLANMAGLARAAYLAQMEYEDRPRAHVLAFVDALEEAQPEIARTMGEALRFSGIEAGTLDVVFLRSSDAICAQLAKVALRFDLPEVEVAERVEVAAPGSDPENPPILR